jgi:hypothetical protein
LGRSIYRVEERRGSEVGRRLGALPVRSPERETMEGEKRERRVGPYKERARGGSMPIVWLDQSHARPHRCHAGAASC